jgi:histidine triad (HIT) family protein
MDCLFCKIVGGEIPSVKVYEDDHTFAFLDIQPNNIGHTLVIPKDHSENIYTISEESFCNTMKTVRKVAIAIKKAVSADGINIAMNNEASAGQAVFHSHIHIIPRFKTDGYKHWPHVKYKDGEDKEIANKIIENLK